MTETPHATIPARLLQEELQARSDCDSDLKHCRDNWPTTPDSWCQGCLNACAAELLEAAADALTEAPHWRIVRETVERIVQTFADAVGGTQADAVIFMQVDFPRLLTELEAALSDPRPPAPDVEGIRQLAQRYRDLLGGDLLPADLRCWAGVSQGVLPPHLSRLREYLAVAADEIERLRVRVADFQNRVSSLSAHLVQAQQERDAVSAEHVRLREAIIAIDHWREYLSDSPKSLASTLERICRAALGEPAVVDARITDSESGKADGSATKELTEAQATIARLTPTADPMKGTE